MAWCLQIPGRINQWFLCPTTHILELLAQCLQMYFKSLVQPTAAADLEHILTCSRTLFTFPLNLIWVRHIAQCWQLGRKLSQKWRFISKFFSIWLIIGFLTLDLSHEQKHILDQFTKYSISRIFLWHWYLIYEALNMKILKSHYIQAGIDSSKMKWCIQILFIAYLELLGQR